MINFLFLVTLSDIFSGWYLSDALTGDWESDRSIRHSPNNRADRPLVYHHRLRFFDCFYCTLVVTARAFSDDALDRLHCLFCVGDHVDLSAHRASDPSPHARQLRDAGCIHCDPSSHIVSPRIPLRSQNRFKTTGFSHTPPSFFSAYAAFIAAFGFGLMYLIAERKIRRKTDALLDNLLPSLSISDELGYRCTILGVILLTMGSHRRESLDPIYPRCAVEMA